MSAQILSTSMPPQKFFFFLVLLAVITFCHLESVDWEKIIIYPERSLSNPNNHKLSALDMEDLFFASYSKARIACEKFDDSKQLPEHERKSSPRLFIDCMDSLEAAQAKVSQTACNEILLIHMFWSKGPLGDVATLSLRSVLHTQPTDCFKVMLWTASADTHHALSNSLAKYNKEREVISVQKLNSTDLINRMKANLPEIAETIVGARRILSGFDDFDGIQATRAVKISNGVRIIVLAAYGGIYLDFDCLVLSSLQPLMGRDFFYRWSTQSYANTAVFGLQLKSSNTATLLEKGLKHIQSLEDLSQHFRPMPISALVQETNASIDRLPSTYFDPLWVLYDNTKYEAARNSAEQRYGTWSFRRLFDPALPNIQVADFFPGAFVFHWHNQWTKRIEQESIARAFLDYYDGIEAAAGLQ